MIKKIFTQLLCAVFTLTAVLPARAAAPAVSADMNEQAIRAQYPNARIIHVAEEDYAQIAARLSEQGYRVAANGVAPVEQDQQQDQQGQQESQKPERTEDDCGKRAQQGETSDDGTFRVIVDATDDILHSGNHGSNRESAAVVFVIVGAIVIVVWALYVIKYLYDSAVGITPCNRWSELTLVSSAISRSSTQHIDFNGVRFMTGFRTGVTDVGIAVELGRSDILLTEASALALKGKYWFLGPMLRWRFSEGKNPHFFQMNFMGGSTDQDEIGVIAKASLGLRFGIGDHMHIGFSWGAMNIRLNNDQGIISDRDQYHYLYGINAGFSF